MTRVWLSGWSAATVLLVALQAGAQPPRLDTVKLFNGSSLAGWKPQGAGEWKVADGALVGVASGAANLLALDRNYQDFVLTFAFQCRECDAGVVLRSVPSSEKSGTTSAIYAGISGPDALTAQRVSLDAKGQELGRTQLFKWVARQNLPYMQMSVTAQPEGWKHVRIMLRGDAAPAAPPATAEAGAPPRAAPPSLTPYGGLALRVTSGELRVKDVEIADLLRPPAGVAAEKTAPEFRKVQLTDRFYAEGISVGDVNHDGKPDAVTGPYAYLGPEFRQSVEIYPPQTYSIAGPRQAGLYTDNFLNYVYDFNGDGWGDYLKINFDGAFLYVNPKGESRHWPVFQVTDGVSSETTQLADIDGDGKPELLMSIGGAANRVIGLAKPGTDPTARWTFVPVSEKGDWGGHGYGYGDLNGDGKTDIVQGSGWWEQPAAGAAGAPWPFHAGPFGRGTDPFVRGADIHVYDVNGDKLPDVITSLFAHGPGLVWYEQQRSGQGPITWKMHMVMDSPDATPEERKTWEISDKSVVFTELHAIALIDMDGDGVKDLVTGKRWWSHGIEYGENDHDDPAVIAWLKLVRKPGGQVEFVPHIINNYVGLGTQIAANDVNGDGRPDVLVAARKGAYIFLNTR